MYYYNCPRYLKLKDAVNDYPEFQPKVKSYEGLFNFISSQTGTNITTPDDVFFLDNLFQTLVSKKLCSIFFIA